MAGTGMYLPANGVRALRALGLEQAVAARRRGDPPPAAAGSPRGASWPRSTWVSCGATSALAWPCPAPTCTPSCGTGAGAAGPRDPVLGAAGWAAAGHLQRPRQRGRVRPGRRRRRAALHGAAAGRLPARRRTVTDALAGFVARRSPRTDWVRAQTHRRDRTRNLPPAVRNLLLRAFGRRIFRSNYRPLLEPT
jgi:hypothetical protein